MSKYLYSELKPALNSWKEDKSLWKNPENQSVKGIYVGYFAPSAANWAYQIHTEILTQHDGSQYLCETIRRFGILEGIIHYQALEYLIA